MYTECCFNHPTLTDAALTKWYSEDIKSSGIFLPCPELCCLFHFFNTTPHNIININLQASPNPAVSLSNRPESYRLSALVMSIFYHCNEVSNFECYISIRISLNKMQQNFCAGIQHRVPFEKPFPHI